MNIKKSFIACALFATAISTAHAGVKDLTWHSRANCGNNESITWQAGKNWDMRTISWHYHGLKVHIVDTKFETTWRSAAVHWGEARPGSGYRVVGNHWVKLLGPHYNIFETDVNDCSIYDGWWD
ncbi:MAG TPA: hypothetical protein VFU62_14095 [Hanamia sp.]|nr:hypothetical protein [Hanamia sp.]